MSFSDYTALDISELETKLHSSEKVGLSTDSANLILKTQGLNEIKIGKTTWFAILLRQFKSAFIYLLLVAATLAFLFGEKVDAVMIVIFILINTILGFYQEYKSDLSLKDLEKYVVNRVKVIRDGHLSNIDSKELVVGDLVVIETGDILQADIRLVATNDLLVNESILTGESIDVIKSEALLNLSSADVYKASNVVFSGTTVTDGGGRGFVIATGRNTEIGKIAKLSTETRDTSSFEKQINKFSSFILYLTVVTLLIVFVIQLITKSDTISVPELIVFSIAMAVGVIPEALPLVTTFSLTHGAKRLAKKKVIAKRLSAIEDLGSIEVLCSDKTGTLTENSMTVSEIWGTDKASTLFYAAVVSDYSGDSKLPNNSFDLAIIKACSMEEKGRALEVEKISNIPFNPSRRRNSTLIKDGLKYEIVVRGAPESLLSHIKGVRPQKLEEITHWLVFQGMYGRRVLLVAKRSYYESLGYTPQDEEKDLELIGLISFEDPIKASTYEAVQKAKKMGIDIKVLTGDSPEVAGAVASKVGIITDPTDVLLGDFLENKSLTERLNLVKAHSVFARVSPEQKYKIIELLEQNHEVGYLGEGINDAPALKLANVGIVVEGASAVARESSDIILLENDLNVIIEGIEEGRRTFVNTTKYIKSTLASNFGNFYALAFASLVIDYLPMLPVQILLVNLLSDFPMISISTDEVEADELKRPHSYDVREITLMASILGVISTFFDFVFFALFKDYGTGPLRTYWFMGSILTELLLIYSIRTRKWFFRTTKQPSFTMEFLTLFAAVATILIPFIPAVSNFFGFVVPSIQQVIVVLAVTLGYFITTEVVKHFYYTRFINYKTRHAKS